MSGHIDVCRVDLRALHRFTGLRSLSVSDSVRAAPGGPQRHLYS